MIKQLLSPIPQSNANNDLLQLNVVVQQPDFFTGLEGWQSNVWASVASEGVAECAVAAAPDLSLDSEVHLGKVIGVELQTAQGLVGARPLGSVFGLDLLLQSAGAVLASASPFSSLGAALRCCFSVKYVLSMKQKSLAALTLNDSSQSVLLCDEIVLVNELVVLASDDRVVEVVAEVDKAHSKRLRRLW